MIPLFAIAAALSAIWFALVWAICLRVKNYGLVDAAWSYTIAVLAPLYVVFGTAPLPRRLLFAGIGILWSLRLGTYLLKRILRHHPTEDVRYSGLRKQWPHPFQFLLFFEAQAVVALGLSIPFLLTAFNTTPTIHPLEWTGLVLAILSLGGESLADRQMKHFKSDPAHAGQVCQAGLWRYSRHPNYFFEVTFWFSIALAAIPSPWGWLAFVSPLMISYFLLKVTGIPLTEEFAVKTKGDAYRAYQRTTSAFFPWFPKQPRQQHGDTK